MRSLGFIVFACSRSAVLSFLTRNMVCCFFFFWSGCSDSRLWLSAFKSCCANPPWPLQPRNILSRQEVSEPIAMETVLKSLERRPPLWLHPIRFKEKLSALLYFTLKCSVGTSVWTWICVCVWVSECLQSWLVDYACVCVCVCLWALGARKWLITPPQGLRSDLASWSSLHLFIFPLTLKLCSTWSPLEQRHELHLAPCTSTVLPSPPPPPPPRGLRVGVQPSPSFFDAWHSASKSSASKPGTWDQAQQRPGILPYTHKRVRQDRAVFPLGSSGFNKANFLTGDTTRQSGEITLWD